MSLDGWKTHRGDCRDDIKYAALDLRAKPDCDHVVSVAFFRDELSKPMFILTGHDRWPLEFSPSGPHETIICSRPPGARVLIEFDGVLRGATININGLILEL